MADPEKNYFVDPDPAWNYAMPDLSPSLSLHSGKQNGSQDFTPPQSAFVVSPASNIFFSKHISGFHTAFWPRDVLLSETTCVALMLTVSPQPASWYTNFTAW